MSDEQLGAFGTLLNDLMSDDALLRAFIADPQAVMAERGLTDSQRKALLSAKDAYAIETEFAKENYPTKSEGGFVRDGGWVRGFQLSGGFVREPRFVRAHKIVERLAEDEREE